MARPEHSTLIGRHEAGAVLECAVAQHNDDYALTTLHFSDGQLRVPRVDLAPGTSVRVRIQSRDVTLALSRPMDVSIMNKLPGRIVSITPQDGPYAEVVLSLGENTLRSLVTRESCDRLGLQPETLVWALVKSVALDGRGISQRQNAAKAPPRIHPAVD
jgi:molybdate transport system ATP-binding protein